MKFNKSLIYFIIIFFILFLSLLIFCHYLFSTPLLDHFDVDNPQRASSDDVSSGSSEYYGWGFDGINLPQDKKKRAKKKCPNCDHVYFDNEVCNITIDDRQQCRYCDITKNKDIDKYVLKSSIPPCPDMSNYATKSMIQPSCNYDKYLLKSKLPQYCKAYYPDNDKYMLKSECPPQPPNYIVYQDVYNDITKHPQYNDYMSKKDAIKFKKSWIQNLEQWYKNVYGIGNGIGNGNKSSDNGNNTSGNDVGKEKFPRGYGFSPYAGYGVDNDGYALDGGQVSDQGFTNQ